MKVIGKIFGMAVLVALLSSNAWASDNIVVTIGDNPSPAPAIKANGNEAIQGTIQLWYVVYGNSFPTGSFGTFTLKMEDKHLNGLENAVYPATMTLKQNGSQNVILTPTKTTFYVSGQGWKDETIVNITIPSGVPNADGTDLVGNLNFSIPGKNKVDTPTSVQVHIKLVHVTNCIKVYNFLADAGATTIFDSAFAIDLKVKDGLVTSNNHGVISYNILASNTCSQDRTVDIGAALDPAWTVQGAQGVKLYSATGDVDLSGYDIDLFANGTNNGTSLCFQNATIPSGETVLLNIKADMTRNTPVGTLGTSFAFSGSLTEPGTGCTGLLDTLASPNPVSATLPYTTSVLGGGGAGSTGKK